MNATLTPRNELERVDVPGYAKASVDEHQPAIDAALATRERALERDGGNVACARLKRAICRHRLRRWPNID